MNDSTESASPAPFVLPTKAATAAEKLAGNPEFRTDQFMSIIERTIGGRTPGMIVKEGSDYTGRRYRLYRSRDTGAYITCWPNRGFIYFERESDGRRKIWTRRDALRIAKAFGLQAQVAKYPDEKKLFQEVYYTLADVCRTAHAQGDPTILTPAEIAARDEAVKSVILPGYGPKVPEKKVFLVGGKVSDNLVQ